MTTNNTDLFQSTLRVPPCTVRDHYTGQSLDRLPLFKTLQEFDADIPVEQTTQVKKFIERNQYNQARGTGRIVDPIPEVEQFKATYNRLKERKNRGQNQELTPNERPLITIHNDGSLVLDGREDIATICLYLKYDTIEVDILGRMPKWKEIVTNLAKVYHKKTLYQPINHPEFTNWEIARGDERIAILNPHFPQLQEKRVLDVGSCLGHFSRWAYNKGAQVVGIEGFKTFYETAKMLNNLEQTDVRYDCSSVVEWLHKDKSTFDLIICLSIIHNIAQQGHPQQAKWALKELSQRSPQMIFDIGEEGEKGDQVTKLGLGLSKANLPEFIKQNSTYTTIQKIGTETTYCNRDLYLLSK